MDTDEIIEETYIKPEIETKEGKNSSIQPENIIKKQKTSNK